MMAFWDRFIHVSSVPLTWVVLAVVLLFLVVHSNKAIRVFLILLSLAVAIGVDYVLDHFRLVSFPLAYSLTIATFLALLVRNSLFTLIIYAWGLLVAYTSIYPATQLTTDIILGIVVGCVVGVVVYLVHYYLNRRFIVAPQYISKRYTSSGYFLGDIYAVGIVVVLTLIYALFRSIFAL